MKGRRISDETARLVRELRRRGLSLRGIARKTRVSKTSVYRLTKDIPWEQDLVQPRCIETEKIVTRERTHLAVPEPQVPQAKMETLDEEKSGLDQLLAYLTQNRTLYPVRPEQAGKQQNVCLTVQNSVKSELDEAEAWVRRIPFASKLYEQIDFQNLLNSMQSKDPLGEYDELRKKILSSAVIMLRQNRLLRSRRLS